MIPRWTSMGIPFPRTQLLLNGAMGRNCEEGGLTTEELLFLLVVSATVLLSKHCHLYRTKLD